MKKEDLQTLNKLFNNRITKYELQGHPFDKAVVLATNDLYNIIKENEGQNIEFPSEFTQTQDNSGINTEPIETTLGVIPEAQKLAGEGRYLSKADITYSPEEREKTIQAIVGALEKTNQPLPPYTGQTMQSPFGFVYQYNAPMASADYLVKSIIDTIQKNKQADMYKSMYNEAQKGKLYPKNISVGYEETSAEKSRAGGGSSSDKDYFLEYTKHVDRIIKEDSLGNIYQNIGQFVSDLLSTHDTVAYSAGKYGQTLGIIESRMNYLKDIDRVKDYKSILTNKDEKQEYYDEVKMSLTKPENLQIYKNTLIKLGYKEKDAIKRMERNILQTLNGILSKLKLEKDPELSNFNVEKYLNYDNNTQNTRNNYNIDDFYNTIKANVDSIINTQYKGIINKSDLITILNQQKNKVSLKDPELVNELNKKIDEYTLQLIQEGKVDITK